MTHYKLFSYRHWKKMNFNQSQLFGDGSSVQLKRIKSRHLLALTVLFIKEFSCYLSVFVIKHFYVLASVCLTNL